MTIGPFYVDDVPGVALAVSITRNGDVIDLENYDSAVARLVNSDGETSLWGSTPVIDIEDNLVEVPAPPSTPFPEAGVYSLFIQLITDPTGVETFFIDYIRVLSLTDRNSWATASEVYSITGATIDDSVILDAQGVVETFCGRTFSGSSSNTAFKQKDLSWLMKAVAYQAEWMPEQPGYKSRHNIKEVIQDGQNVVYVGSSEAANPALLMLAPLAFRAIKNLSWMGTRSVRFAPPRLDRGRYLTADEYRCNDDHGGWEPL